MIFRKLRMLLYSIWTDPEGQCSEFVKLLEALHESLDLRRSGEGLISEITGK